MKKEYDFSKAKRGAVAPLPKTKERITIRLDSAILEYFRNEVEKTGGGCYQSLINNALREYVDRKAEPMEVIFRRVLREELHHTEDQHQISHG